MDIKKGEAVAGQVCVLCGKVRGTNTSVIHRWHHCKKCSIVYCDKCARALAGTKGPLHGSRYCPRCGGRTELC